MFCFSFNMVTQCHSVSHVIFNAKLRCLYYDNLSLTKTACLCLCSDNLALIKPIMFLHDNLTLLILTSRDKTIIKLIE